MKTSLKYLLAIAMLVCIIFGCNKLGLFVDGKPIPSPALPVPACIAYVEVNGDNLNNMGCFTMNNGKPIVSVASIFAANINFLNGDHSLFPVVALNPQTAYLLTQTTYVKDLQAKGIKVTMSLLNNHDHSGWGQFYSQAEADSFARSVQVAVTRFHLDGIEIDDEYADSAGNTASLTMVVRSIRQLMPNIIIGYYIYADDGVDPSAALAYVYPDNVKFSDLITYAIGNFYDPLSEYTSSIAKTKLFWESADLATDATDAANAKANGYGGVMIFNANSSSQDAFNAVAQAFYGDSVTVSTPDGCLQSGGQQSPNAPGLTYIY